MRERLFFTVLVSLGAMGAGCPPLTTPGDDAGSGSDGGALQCGTTSCTQGTVCCNASCGICTPPGRACIQIACDPSSVGKSCADLSCDAGDTCMETRSGPQCVPSEENPCNLADCPEKTTCEVVMGEAQCIPIPEVDAGPVVTPGSCAVVLCAGICRDVPGGFICEPAQSDAGTQPGASCAATLCPTDTYCDDISGSAQCIPLPSCKTVKCSSGHHCELQEVQCIRAPCPPQPACVPDTDRDPCSRVKCAAGTHCEAIEVQCIRAPCPPIAQCVPDSDGIKCGKNTCGAGTYCCNASCGACAPKGGACTQQICNPSE